MDQFDLTPAERFILGTSLRDDVLILRPTFAMRMLVLPLLPIAMFFGIVLVANNARSISAATAAMAGALVFIGAAGYLTVGIARSRIVASPAGLTIRDRWRERHWTWTDVDGFTVDHAQVNLPRAAH